MDEGHGGSCARQDCHDPWRLCASRGRFVGHHTLPHDVCRPSRTLGQALRAPTTVVRASRHNSCSRRSGQRGWWMRSLDRAMDAGACWVAWAGVALIQASRVAVPCARMRGGTGDSTLLAFERLGDWIERFPGTKSTAVSQRTDTHPSLSAVAEPSRRIRRPSTRKRRGARRTTARPWIV
jgi:hypothetical protein